MYEVLATGGDIRRLCDLFGLFIGGAERYLSVLNHPSLMASDEDQDNKVGGEDTAGF